MPLPFPSPPPLLFLSMPEECRAEGNLRICWQPQLLLCCLEQFRSGPDLQRPLSNTKVLQITRPSPVRRLCRGHHLLLQELVPAELTPHLTQFTTHASDPTESLLQRNVHPVAFSVTFGAHLIKGP